MLKSTFAFLTFFLCLHIHAQSGSSDSNDPVQWAYRIEKTGENTGELHILATMRSGWHIYAQSQPQEAVSQPTKISFLKNPLIAFTGKPREIGEREVYTDAAVGIKQFQYSDKVEFVQVLKWKTGTKTNIRGSISFQSCTREKCLPPRTVSFSLSIL